ncbi:clusterin-like protein 1 isoform X2 [Clupea harengus]|nr:clusterin-like protein 1 isoform X2 [Clupea harengus]
MMRMMKSMVLLSLLSLAASGSPSDDKHTHTHTLNLELQHPQLLARLSAAGEQCVVGEIKRALLGVKQLREMLDTQQHTHLQLMETLTHSYNKKRGAEQLAQGVEQKLREAELHCHGALKSRWAECRPCLEESCRLFYTSTCHRDNTFTLQVEELFRRVSSHLDAQEQLYNQNPEEDRSDPSPVPDAPDSPSGPPPAPAEGLPRLIESLTEASEEAEALYARCLATVAGMRSVLGPAFHMAFSEELRPQPLPPTGLGGVTHTLLQLGRSAFQEVESVVQEVSSALQEVEFAVQEVGSTLSGLLQGLQTANKDKKVEEKAGAALCRQLRRQPANCWRLQDQCSSCTDTFLTECPTVSQQYSELQDIHLLVNASRLQYSEVQQVALRHVENTLLWANHMTAKHAWVTHITNGSTAPKHTFSITKLTPGGSDQLEGSASEAWHVEACLLDSPPITMSVPTQLEPTDPAFINYVTQEALEVFKHSIPTATSSRSDQG